MLVRDPCNRAGIWLYPRFRGSKPAVAQNSYFYMKPRYRRADCYQLKSARRTSTRF